MANEGLTRVLAVAPYANPHVTSIYDALAGQPGVVVQRATLRALPPERLALGWPEMPADAPYLQPWRREADRGALRRELRAADIAILPGPFHFRWLPFAFAWRLMFSRGPILAWSEPFLDFRERSRANLAALSVTARLLDSPRVHLLSIGARALADYRAIGVTKWRARLFEFGVEPEPESALPRAQRGAGAPLKLLFAGELIERKRVDLLLDALALPEFAGAAWQLDIVGSGPLRGSLEKQAQALGLCERVAFRGTRARPDLLRSLREVDAVILPSRFDGWGAIVNEALEASVTAIVSDACGVAALLESSGGGLVFRSGDAASLAACLSRLIAEPDLARRLGAAGHAAMSAHRPEAIANRLAALCRGLDGQAALPDFKSGVLSELP